MTRSLLIPGLALGLASCSPPGTSRVEVTGEVRYAGKPLPSGVLYLEPRGGLIGPQGIADIVNGRFQTRPGWGAVVGPHTARVEFFLSSGNPREATLPAYGEGGLIVDEVTYVTRVEIPAEGGEPIRIEIPDELR